MRLRLPSIHNRSANRESSLLRGRGLWRTLILAILALLSAAILAMFVFSRQLHRGYEQEVRSALGLYAQPQAQILTDADIADLPDSVQQYLRYVGVVGQEKVWNVRAAMSGRLRSSLKSAWMPTESVQYNFAQNPERLYYLDARMMGLPVYGLHLYKQAHASMLIKALGVVPVLNQTGFEMDRSDTVTLLNDMALMAPAMLTDPRITWQEVDDHTAIATLTNGANIVSASLIFDDAGALVDFLSHDRYREFERMDWSTPITEYAQFGVHRLPSKAAAIWHAPEGDYTYAEFEIKEIAYNEEGFR
jgi:hypothetical protein